MIEIYFHCNHVGSLLLCFLYGCFIPSLKKIDCFVHDTQFQLHWINQENFMPREGLSIKELLNYGVVGYRYLFYCNKPPLFGDVS